MPLVVVQTTIPGNGPPFRITEVLGRVADTAEQALEIAAVHIGDPATIEEFLTARWHENGGYWLVSYEPAPEMRAGERVLVH